jgi:transcriptional regulator with XRE-family HTH domain
MGTTPPRAGTPSVSHPARPRQSWSARQAAQVDIENGRSRPRLMTIRKIAGALEVEPTQVREFRDVIERGPHRRKLAA